MYAGGGCSNKVGSYIHACMHTYIYTQVLKQGWLLQSITITHIYMHTYTQRGLAAETKPKSEDMAHIHACIHTYTHRF